MKMMEWWVWDCMYRKTLNISWLRDYRAYTIDVLEQMPEGWIAAQWCVSISASIS
jgi:hypothetical protein